MHPRHDVWQGCSEDWQNHFIQQNLLLLGYAAWDGYLHQGRGVLICKVIDVIPISINWQVERVQFAQRFIPEVQIGSDLQESGLEPAAIAPLLQAVATYDPAYEIVVLIQGNGTIDINLLQPKMTPPHCHEQVKRRWAEFQLECFHTPRRFYGRNT
jgi:hypothetical protein